MIVAGTGHRPPKLGGYGDTVASQLKRGAAHYLKNINPRASGVISGMALGWDTALAEAAIELGIPLTAAVPFKGQEGRWPAASQEKYHALLAQAKTVIEVSPSGYAAWKMQRRNEWMVDRADRIVALWDGSPGGTANCLAYAKEKGVEVDNLWSQWAARSVPNAARTCRKMSYYTAP